ncbi:MAG: AAA family ATPase [Myxococcales bacterium]|nr:AAA family ATPase [Myxococcales bacterium]
MTILPGYTIRETIHEGIRSVIYRAVRDSDQAPVVIKAIRDYRERQQVAQLRHEYQVIKTLEHPGVIRALALQDFERRLALIFEDIGGVALDRVLKRRRLPLAEFLRISIQLCSAVEAIHHGNIIHKDIKPHNIIYNEETARLKLTDFASSSSLPRENPVLTGSGAHSGTLAYMSPEQTGRMNRGVDYRTDFYSMGVTFYEMLTGRWPFVFDDPIELVHAHIAIQPTHPRALDPSLPEQVSELVMKLLSKRAEDRYQSAYGIRVDLERCLAQLERDGEIARFPLATEDYSEEFRLSQKLYGRDESIAQLLATFDRVCAGTCEVVLVPGYSGIGKSSLVNEIQRPIVGRRGFFAAGKCDQFNRNSPFSALLQALRQLVRQVLAEPEDGVARWRARLLEVVGHSGELLNDVIPELRHLIGPQPPAQQLPASEAQNRLLLLLVGFTRVFASEQHPLVVFLDDLQWADVATLRMLQLLSQDSASRHLLIIGSYRDNEVTPAHPLNLTIEQLRQGGARVSELRLSPLSLAHVTELIADALHMSADEVATLAEPVFARTRGNPFFTRQLLRFLYEENILNFDLERRRWEWDVERVLEAGDTDNVIDLTAREIDKLPQSTREAMKLAACLGSTFSGHVLAELGEQRGIALKDLWQALQRGLIIPVDSTSLFVADELLFASEGTEGRSIRFKFLHDGVRQAAYTMLGDAERDAIHSQIGTHLLQLADASDSLDELLFAIVGHFNRTPRLVTDAALRLRLAELNRDAGQRAKNSGAYKLALAYLRGGLQFLPADAFERHYALAVGLTLQQAECEYLAGNFEEAEQAFTGLIARVRTRAERGNILAMQANLAASQARHQEGIELGVRGLALMGIEIPITPGPEVIPAAIGRVIASLQRHEIPALVDLPAVTDPNKEVIATLYSSIAASAYQVNQQLFPLLILELVDLSLNHGNTRFSSFGYVVYGLVTTTALGDPASGVALADAGLSLAAKQGDRMLLARGQYLMANFVQHWTRPMREGLALLHDAYKGCIASGDLYYAGYSLLAITWRRFSVGDPLSVQHSENVAHLDFLANRSEDPDTLVMTLARHRTVVALMGTGDDLSVWTSYTVDEHKPSTHLCYIKTAAGERALFMRRTAEARAALASAQAMLPFVAGNFLEAECVFYRVLALAADYDELPADEQAAARAVFNANLEMLERWAQWCPENFSCFLVLARAEVRRALPDEGEGEPMALYERAITEAERGARIHVAALASELAGRYQLARGRRSLARAYLNDALYAYERWGAAAKVDALAEEFSAFLGSAREGFTSGPIETTTGSATVTMTGSTSRGDRVDKLDVQTVIRSANAFAAEIVFGRLLETMMKIIMANAGAERGFLMFERGDEWVIDIEAGVSPGEAQVNVKRLKNISVSTTDKLSASIVNYVARTRETVLLKDATRERPFNQDPYVRRTQPKSLLALPLTYQGKLNGILYLENNLTTDAFTEARVALLNVLSSQAAISIENASLYDTLEQKVAERTSQLAERTSQLAHANAEITALNERLKAENLRMEAELDVVQKLQRMLLPHDDELNQVEDLEIAGYMSPADEVGGDYYDVLVHDGRVLAAIGDVTGHGLESGVLMLMTQMGVRTLLTSGETDPVRFLDVLNRTIYDNIRRIQTEKYLTLCLLKYEDGVLRLSGLHEELIIVRSGGRVELIDTLTLGLPIGLTEDIADSVSETIIELAPGDQAVLFTDGITEAESPEGVRYGLPRFCELLGANAGSSAHELVEVVIRDVQSHIGTQVVYDDITLLVMKRR